MLINFSQLISDHINCQFMHPNSESSVNGQNCSNYCYRNSKYVIEINFSILSFTVCDERSIQVLYLTKSTAIPLWLQAKVLHFKASLSKRAQRIKSKKKCSKNPSCLCFTDDLQYFLDLNDCCINTYGAFYAVDV